MNTAILSILVFAVLQLAYHLLLSKNQQFRVNRVILLCVPLLAFMATMIDFSFFSVSKEAGYMLPEVKANVNARISKMERQHLDIISMIYWSGVAVFTSLFLLRLFRTFRQNHSVAGFSFLNKFYVNEALQEETQDAILSHEKLHANQLHSVDIIFLELVRVFFWFNPLYPFFMKTVRLNHEYEADHYAAQKHENYSKILVSQQFNVDYALLGHSFSKSNLKQRLIMIESKKKSIRLRHYLLFACLAGASVSANAWIPEVSEQLQVTHHDPSDEDGDAVQPEFKGGTDALMEYMIKEIKYPKSARKEGIEGRVIVAFIVDENGSVKEASVKQSSDNSELDKEAVRAVKSMPNWKPGTKKGKAASFEMFLPVVFKLPPDDK